MITHEFPNICHRNHRSSRLLNPRNSPFFSCANFDSASDLFPVHVDIDVDVIAASLSPECQLCYIDPLSARPVTWRNLCLRVGIMGHICCPAPLQEQLYQFPQVFFI
jgi:hypothetical protein